MENNCNPQSPSRRRFNGFLINDNILGKCFRSSSLVIIRSCFPHTGPCLWLPTRIPHRSVSTQVRIHGAAWEIKLGVIFRGNTATFYRHTLRREMRFKFQLHHTTPVKQLTLLVCVQMSKIHWASLTNANQCCFRKFLKRVPRTFAFKHNNNLGFPSKYHFSTA